MQPGEHVLIHAGAGGVGSLAIQLAKARGAGRVIATASSEEKRELARQLGADETLPSDAGKEEIVAAGGHRVDVVLEMVGGPSFDASLAALAPFGRLITYGMASRVPSTPVQPTQLMLRSVAVIGFWLAYCFRRPEMLASAMEDPLEMTAVGELQPVVGGTYALAEASDLSR